MGDRIVVLIANPGRIRTIVNVNLPRPRDALSPEFIAIQRHINELVRD